jgi:ribonuclease HI
LDEIKSAKNHNHLVEGIRKRAVNLYKKNRTIEFNWVKAHAEIYGNGIADRLAKEATKLLCNLQQNTKKRHKKGCPGRKHKKMAKSMGGNNERSD